MEPDRINEAELLAHICRILEGNNRILEQAAEQSEQVLQVQGMAVDFAARRVQIEGFNVDFGAGSVQAWEKNIYLGHADYETLSHLADQLGVTVDGNGFLVRISGDDLEIPIVLYISPSAE